MPESTRAYKTLSKYHEWTKSAYFIDGIIPSSNSSQFGDRLRILTYEKSLCKVQDGEDRVLQAMGCTLSGGRISTPGWVNKTATARKIYDWNAEKRENVRAVIWREFEAANQRIPKPRRNDVVAPDSSRVNGDSTGISADLYRRHPAFLGALSRYATGIPFKEDSMLAKLDTGSGISSEDREIFASFVRQGLLEEASESNNVPLYSVTEKAIGIIRDFRNRSLSGAAATTIPSSQTSATGRTSAVTRTPAYTSATPSARTATR
ncbi:hypothetical protein ACIQB5_51525 [Streptomyces sp. NPDC088560]|uniref:hypothetical protein n=1 Tax=Streptomyces sp. NPDC088560 TaxID=3365868 RepID=UPI0037FBA804